jgi:hypothetical protein
VVVTNCDTLHHGGSIARCTYEFARAKTSRIVVSSGAAGLTCTTLRSFPVALKATQVPLSRGGQMLLSPRQHDEAALTAGRLSRRRHRTGYHAR